MNEGIWKQVLNWVIPFIGTVFIAIGTYHLNETNDSIQALRDESVIAMKELRVSLSSLNEAVVRLQTAREVDADLRPRVRENEKILHSVETKMLELDRRVSKLENR